MNDIVDGEISSDQEVESGSDVSSHQETRVTTATDDDILNNTTTDENDAQYLKSPQLGETNEAMNDHGVTMVVQSYGEIYDNNGTKVDTKANVETAFTVVQKRMKGGRKSMEVKTPLSS